MRDEEIGWLDAGSIVAGIRAGDLTAERVIEATLDRIEKVNPQLNAFARVTADSARAAARAADKRRTRGQVLGPLDGVPVTIKDILWTKGVVTDGGSRLFADFAPDRDAIVVERLTAAGAIVIGKTTTPEYCHKTTTDSPLHGVTRNPWNLDLTTGGSSGGSAAAVAAGLGAISIGTDGGGSIRLPAALCGVAGLKPSAGRVAQGPGFAGWNMLGHTGPLARTVACLQRTLAVISGAHPADPLSCMATPRPLPTSEPRIAWATSLDALEPEPHVADALARTVETARGLTAERVANVSLRWDDPDLNFRKLIGSDLAGALATHVEARADVMEPSLVKLVEFGRSLGAVDLARALDWRLDFTARVLAFFADYDLLIVPTAPVTAFSHAVVGPTTIAGRKTSPYAWFGWTWPFNMTGQPALSLPVMSASGLPAGIQIIGRPGEDDLVLAFARRIEHALGPQKLRPPLAAATASAHS
jgi:aspartyl-tRNA(Asn)/glutamyl-tRNA(Gln) amidotransferase subunit A